MDRFRYEYFIVNIGSANFRGAGSSLKQPQTHKYQERHIKFMVVGTW